MLSTPAVGLRKQLRMRHRPMQAPTTSRKEHYGYNLNPWKQ